MTKLGKGPSDGRRTFPFSPLLSRFARKTDGALTLFALVMLPVLFIAAGVALDMMRQESTRVALQQAFDRCVLNAASLQNRSDPNSTVKTCVEDAGFEKAVKRIEVENSDGRRRVAIAGEVVTPTFFLDALGIDETASAAASEARQRVSNIEVSLVLDVSGSMAGDRLAGLKAAAKSFVSALIASYGDRVSIGIIPYNTTVNFRDNFAKTFNASDKPFYSNANCLEIPPALYDMSGRPETVNWSYTASFDFMSLPWSNTLGNEVYRPVPYNSVCPPSTVNVVLPPTNDAQVLNAHIDNLVALGNTSIQIGMKWGSILLSRQMNPQFRTLSKMGVIPEIFNDRPLAPDPANTLKVIVLMTDGENTVLARLNPNVKTGPSPFFRSKGAYYYYYPRSGLPSYFHVLDSVWSTYPGGESPDPDARQLDWREVYQEIRLAIMTTAATDVRWLERAAALKAIYPPTYQQVVVGSTVYNIPTDPYWSSVAPLLEYEAIFQTVTAEFVSYDEPPKTNAQLQASCAADRAAGVVIYGVAFDAPDEGQSQIRQCATSPQHYFDATNAAALNAAFQSIAIDINQLRLTQ